MIVEAAQDQQGILKGGGQCSRRQGVPADGTGPQKRGKSPQSSRVLGEPLTQARALRELPRESVCWPRQLYAMQGCRGGTEGRKKVEKLRKGKWKRN